MKKTVDSTEQLVLELFVDDIEKTRDFYARLGFETVAAEGGYTLVTWEGHQLILEGKHRGLPPNPSPARFTLRILVPDVERYWELVQEMGAEIVHPLDVRWGNKDFTFLDPDGFALRFATRLAQADTS